MRQLWQISAVRAPAITVSAPSIHWLTETSMRWETDMKARCMSIRNPFRMKHWYRATASWILIIMRTWQVFTVIIWRISQEIILHRVKIHRHLQS